MDAIIITKTYELEKIENDWKRLENQSPEVTYYSTYEYNSIWWNVYKNNKKLSLFIICIYNDNKIVGIAPLVIEATGKRIKYNILKFLGRSDYFNLLIDFTLPKPISVIKEIFKCIEKKQALWDQLLLTHINQHSLLASFLFKSKYNQHFKYLMETPYLDIQSFTDYKTYKSNFLAKKINQYKNKLKHYTNYYLKLSNENEIAKISKIHINQKTFMKNTLARHERHSLFEDQNRYQFYFDLYEKSDNKTTYLLLTNNNIIIGYDTGFLYKSIFHSWNIAFNPEFNKYHIGKIINDEIIFHNFKNNIWKVFDFGSGRYPWKFELTDQFNLVYELNFIKPACNKVLLYKKIQRIKHAIKS